MKKENIVKLRQELLINPYLLKIFSVSVEIVYRLLLEKIDEGERNL